MRLTLLSGAAIALTLMAAPQFAAAQPDPANAPQVPGASAPAIAEEGGAVDDANARPSMDSPLLNGSAAAASSAASDASANEAAIPLSSPTPADQQSGLTADSPSVVSNGPVADTPENRAKYGAPLSNAGKHTPARGN